MSVPKPAHQRHISTWGTAALGVGSMVGAGIFALLGQIANNVRNESGLVFILAGIAALCSGYSYARLSAKFPSRGGISDFFALGFGSPRIERALSNLYLVTVILSLALVAKAFGAYAARLLHQPEHDEWVNSYATAIILVLTFLNFTGTRSVGRIEQVLVAVKLAIMVLFIVIGTITLHPDLLEEHHNVPRSMLFSSIGLAFFAYSGFGVMANASADIKHPEKNMPRAFMLAIGVVIVLYVALALVVLGNVAPENLVKYADTAVAEAAMPVLGHWGFLLVAVAALFATASSLLANIFSLFNMTNQMGSTGALPALFRHNAFAGGSYGFYGLTLLVIVLINSLNLLSIANVASATYLASYLAVFIVCWRRRRECHANPFILVFGFAFMLAIFISFIGEMIAEALWLQCATLVTAALACLLIGWRTPAQPESSKQGTTPDKR